MAAARYLLGSGLNPRSTWCHFGRARALQQLGRFMEAQNSFSEAEASTEDERLLELIDEARSAS
jgi:hypothetical protein